MSRMSSRSSARAPAACCRSRLDAALNGRTIAFNTGSAGITKAGQTVLKSLVAPLKAGGAARVVIGGYTDNVGEANANLRLSRARANSVKVFLVEARRHRQAG